MMDNLNLLKEVMIDVGNEIDANQVEVDKLKLTEQRVMRSVEEMQ